MLLIEKSLAFLEDKVYVVTESDLPVFVQIDFSKQFDDIFETPGSILLSNHCSECYSLNVLPIVAKHLLFDFSGIQREVWFNIAIFLDNRIMYPFGIMLS